MSTPDQKSIIDEAGSVLQSADEALVDMLENLEGGSNSGSGTIDSSTSTTATDVAEIAAANQAISNTISAASQAISTAKQDDQKITQAQTRG